MNPKYLEEKIALGLMVTATAIIAGSVILLLGTIIMKGMSALNLDMVTKTPEGGFYLGKEGGILNAILGSLYLTFGATLTALLLSLPIALYLNRHTGKTSRLVAITRISLDILWGIPSIVYGAFGFTILLMLGLRASLLGGIITVSILIFPIMTRAMDEIIRMVPSELIEASYALGATRFETALKVVVRQSLPGLLSAVFIAFGRGIGDAASVIFTAGFSDRIPTSLTDPAATLPLTIFFQLGTPFPEVQKRAYASAFILTILILFLSLMARLFARRYNRHVLS